jgi:PAS domain S-box-containing protein
MEVNVPEHPILPDNKETQAPAPGEDQLSDHPGEAPANDHLAIFTKAHTKHIKEAKESKRKKAATNDYAKHFRNYLALTNDVMFSYDNQLKILSISPNVERILGYKAEELVGKTLGDLNIIHPYYLHEATQNALQRISGKELHSSVYQFITKDGTTLFGEVSSVPMIHKGHVVQVVSVARDITQHKLFEEELKKHRDRLEELVKERTLDLTKAYERLKLENDVRKNTEATLRSREIDLEKNQIHLEEMNAALRVLIRQRDEDKACIEANISTNIKSSVLPFLEKLKTTGLNETQRSYLSEVELQLKDIASSYIKELSSEYFGLSPCEIQVAILIKEGKSSKDIAKLMNISLNTVLSHRYYIRIKTGLKGKKANLSAYLQTLK